MAPFTPVTFRTARDYEFNVASLCDVLKALSMTWPDKKRELYQKAVKLAESAQDGWCAPRAAMAAFVLAASNQGCIVQGRKMSHIVARELAAIELEDFGALPASDRVGPRRRAATASQSAHL
ncbi:hypothetical protein CYK37_20700 [Mesorhizobium loti]|nr:DUF982 domain-containing protein [Mesorhizobium loti]PLP57544.1 hypothetical protein CYK37_20700 [Mesorhizobium loti]